MRKIEIACFYQNKWLWAWVVLKEFLESREYHTNEPFSAQGVSLWRVKSSGVRQSKIYKSLLGIKGLIALCSFKEVRQNFSEEKQFLSVNKSNSFCFWGLCPWTPNGALPLYPAGDLGRPQSPRLCKGASGPQCRLLSHYLHLLEILLITLDCQTKLH